MQVWRFAAVEGTLSQGERLALVTAPQVLVERVSLQAHQAHSWPSSGVGEVCRPSCFEKIPDKSHCGCFFFFFLNMARRLRGQPTEVGKLGSGSLVITLGPVVREQREKDAGALPLSLFINLRVGAVHVQGGLSHLS